MQPASGPTDGKRRREVVIGRAPKDARGEVARKKAAGRCNAGHDQHVVQVTGAVVAPSREERVMVVVEVVAGIVLFVGVLLAVDGFTAGRAKGRMLARARDQNPGNAGIGYAVIERQGISGQDQSGSI